MGCLVHPVSEPASKEKRIHGSFDKIKGMGCVLKYQYISMDL